MDELSLLHKMRADTPPATDTALTNGYHQLLERTRRPAAPVPHQQSVKSARRHPRLIRFGVASMATAAVVATLISTDVVGLAGWRGAATAQAAQVLNEAAETTIQTSDPVVGPGQYLRIESTNMWPSFASDAAGKTYSWLDTESGTMYIPFDQDDEWVWLRSARTPTTFFDEEAKAYAEATHTDLQGQELRGVGGRFYGSDDDGTTLSEEYLKDLPRDPYRLLNSIYKQTIGQGNSVDGQALTFIGDLLRTGLVPADLRASLYQAAALIPGVTLTDTEATLDGRTGIAIGRVEDETNMRRDIIIDPTTGLLIGEREITLEPLDGIPAGTVTTLASIQTSVTDTAP